MTVKIPSEKIAEGIKVSLEKTEEHLAGAEVLIENKNINNAVVLVEFAIEEFGRAVALREKLQERSEDVEIYLFTKHVYKYDKAWSVLPIEMKTIYEGSFSPLDFPPDEFDAGSETMSPRTHLDATFVNYDKVTQEWKKGIQADPERLASIITKIREEIANFKW
jgi:AbiV family abortive infection protein